MYILFDSCKKKIGNDLFLILVAGIEKGFGSLRIVTDNRMIVTIKVDFRGFI